MLSTILWILGGIAALVFLYFALKIFFFAWTIKKLFSWAKEEQEQLPADYQKMRKEVANENSAAKPTARFVKSIFIRWYKRM